MTAVGLSLAVASKIATELDLPIELPPGRGRELGSPWLASEVHFFDRDSFLDKDWGWGELAGHSEKIAVIEYSRACGDRFANSALRCNRYMHHLGPCIANPEEADQFDGKTCPCSSENDVVEVFNIEAVETPVIRQVQPAVPRRTTSLSGASSGSSSNSGSRRNKRRRRETGPSE